MSYYDRGWAPYVPVAERRRRAVLAMGKLAKKGHPVAPVVIEGAPSPPRSGARPGATTWKATSDFENRLPRGRTYVRNGSVVDLQIAPREVTAMVSGSSLYQVTVSIDAGAAGALAVDLQGLRGRDRFAGRAAAGPAVAGCDGAHLPAGSRAVPRAAGDPLHVQLPGLRVDVQARGGGAVRRRRPAGPAAGTAVPAARGR